MIRSKIRKRTVVADFRCSMGLKGESSVRDVGNGAGANRHSNFDILGLDAAFLLVGVLLLKLRLPLNQLDLPTMARPR